MDNLTFQQVMSIHLKVNKKYLIRYVEGNNIKYLKGYYIRITDNSGFICFCMGPLIFNALRYFLSNTSYYYDIILQKQNIQDAMELRAINKILQRLIGDESFTY